MTDIKKKLQEVYPGFAYELLQLQMAVEDSRLSPQPSVQSISKLIRLYMIGVEILENMADNRFSYFSNKLNSLIMKRHVVKKLHEAAGVQNKNASMAAVVKEQLKDKKQEYEMQKLLNKEQADIKRVKEMLSTAYNKQMNFQGKIKKDIQSQQQRLNERIRDRRLRSQGKRNHRMTSSSPEYGTGEGGTNQGTYEWFPWPKGASGVEYAKINKSRKR